ncbi:MAG: alpha/beta hydrolase [Litorimonas sp.]
MDGRVHLTIRGRGRPLVLLPPAPHTGAFFDPLLPHLERYQTVQVDYPGYGRSAALEVPSIEAYAAAIAPHLPDRAVLVGFHTGNLVAAELSHRIDAAGIVMIDVPVFDEDTRRAYTARTDDTPRSAAFRAAFAYDPDRLRNVAAPTRVIATQSSLHGPSRLAATMMDCPLTERIDVSAPVFEAYPEEMAAEIGRATASFSIATGGMTGTE